MPEFCIMLRNDNFKLEKYFKNQFYSLYGLLLSVRKHLKIFYRSAVVERLGTIARVHFALRKLMLVSDKENSRLCSNYEIDYKIISGLPYLRHN